MNSQAWSEVLQSHAASASDDQLLLLAQAAIKDASLQNEAVQWSKKSARTNQQAMEWIEKNYSILYPKKNEIFDKFAKNPSDFWQLDFERTYPQELVKFLKTLSKLYRYQWRITIQEIPKDNIYARYLFLIHALYLLTTKSEYECLNALKKLDSHYLAKCHFGNSKYPTLEKIIDSIENNTLIYDVRLAELNYLNAIRFIAGLAKIELADYEK